MNDVCWCGVKKPYYAPQPNRCEGTGYIECFCGGDLCVCHWHGGEDCPGCEDCESGEDDD